ncbi:MAG: hypothetical protein JWN80_249 [Microbacteriaceae bacterium]|nr:hypothetical protein [Microbacteriaceae bacterium]
MRKRTKIVAVVAISVVLAGTATAAFAYWSALGYGGGQAITGQASLAMEAVQEVAISDLGPGVAPETLSGDFTNSGGPAYVTSVTASIIDVQGGLGACDVSDYVITDPIMLVGAEIPNGQNQGSWSGATIAFVDNPLVNQDGCQGAVVDIEYDIA